MINPVNSLPIVVTGGPYFGFTDENLEFDGSKSSDPDGDEIIKYLWEINNFEVVQGDKVVYSFNNPGNYTIKLTITDSNGGISYKTTYALISENTNSEITDNDNENNFSIPYFYILLIFIIILIVIIIIKLSYSKNNK